MAHKLLELFGLRSRNPDEQLPSTENLTLVTPEAEVDPLNNKELKRNVDLQTLADVMGMLHDPNIAKPDILAKLSQAIGQIITLKMTSDKRGYGTIVDPLQHGFSQQVESKLETPLQIDVPVHYLSPVDRRETFVLSLTPPGTLRFVQVHRATFRAQGSGGTGHRKFISH